MTAELADKTNDIQGAIEQQFEALAETVHGDIGQVP